MKRSSGVRPPDTTRLALPFAAIPWRRASAIFPAKFWFSAIAPENSTKLAISFPLLELIPGATVTGDHCHGGDRTPGTGLVRFWCFTFCSPGVHDGVDPLPGFLYFITAHEQRLNTAHGFQQQTLVSIGDMLFVEGLGEAQIQLGGLQTVLVLKTRHFVQHFNLDTFIRLQTNGQFVLR